MEVVVDVAWFANPDCQIVVEIAMRMVAVVGTAVVAVAAVAVVVAVEGRTAVAVAAVAAVEVSGSCPDSHCKRH